MKHFRTELTLKPSRATIQLKNGILTQGSCFSDAIGDRLAMHKVKTLVNPFGVMYNPESIHKVLSCSIFNESVAEHTFLHHQEVFFNYNFHSEFSAPKKDELASRLTNTIGSAHYFLRGADWLLLTYGTAWVYQRKDTGEIVANCHKQPAGAFSKSLMTVDAVVTSFKLFFEQLKRFNPQIKLILTVSPVRHLKDSLELNSVSKSILRVACHQVTEQYDDVEYFPAYEMMMDDLRDYRFYRSDMLHPNEEAEDYIWEKFMERYFSLELRDFVGKWKIIQAAIRHKPFHPETRAHQQFLLETLNKLDAVKNLVNVEEEINAVKRQMLKMT